MIGEEVLDLEEPWQHIISGELWSLELWYTSDGQKGSRVVIGLT